MGIRLKLKSAQSDQSPRQHEETLHPWLSKMRQAKILIRQHECKSYMHSKTSLNIRWAHLPESTFSDVADQLVTLRKHAYSNILKFL